jgi:hypothetical protein
VRAGLKRSSLGVILRGLLSAGGWAYSAQETNTALADSMIVHLMIFLVLQVMISIARATKTQIKKKSPIVSTSFA